MSAVKKVIAVLLITNFFVLNLAQLHAQELMTKEEFTQICETAMNDAQKDVNSTLWFGAGCLLGIIGVGIAFFYEPTPPQERLMGKSPQYVDEYLRCYRDKARSIQTTKAAIGWVVSIAAITVFYITLIVLLSGSSS